MWIVSHVSRYRLRTRGLLRARGARRLNWACDHFPRRYLPSEKGSDLIDDTRSLDLAIAVRFTRAAWHWPPGGRVGTGRGEHRRISIFDETDRELIIIAYEELPLFRPFLEHLDQTAPP